MSGAKFSDCLLDDTVLHQLEKNVTADLLPRVVKTLIGEARKRLPNIEESGDKGEKGSAGSEAYALTRAAGTFGASVLKVAALELEQAAIEGRADIVPARLPSLLAAARDTLDLMEKRFGI